MKCLSMEDLICLAMDPLREENCAAALHIARCSKCRENYQLALESVSEDGYEASAEEIAAAEKAAGELTGTSRMWNRFFETVDELSKKISSPAGNIFKRSPFGTLRSENTVLLAAAAAPGIRSMKFAAPAEDIKFTFESYAAPESGNYWKMQMTLPRIPSSSSLILMKVTGLNGSFLEGTMDFLNRKTELCCGTASLPFMAFIENKSCKEISFISKEGTVSPGRIKFLPEALQ